MKIKILHLFFAILFLATACKEGKGNNALEEKGQMKAVMAVHDEVMPKMGAIGKLVGQLKPMVDSTAKGQEYEKAIRDLQGANHAMMEWMQGFGDTFDSDEIMEGKALSAEKQQLLNEQEAAIKAVKEKFEASIAKAEALLKN